MQKIKKFLLNGLALRSHENLVVIMAPESDRAVRRRQTLGRSRPEAKKKYILKLVVEKL